MRLTRRQAGYVGLGLLLAVVALAFGGPLADVGSPGEPVGDGQPTAATTNGSGEHPATVMIASPNGTELGRIDAMVADSPAERYTGLSDTDSLGPNEGMVFIYPRTAERTFVMREMAFPLDMLFVDGNGTITRIHHAPVESDGDLTPYTGSAKWVVEVNRGWADEHGVSVGDRVTVHLSR